MKVSGLTLATSISSILTTILMMISLNKKLNGINLRNMFISFVKILCSSIIMGIAIFFINKNSMALFGMNMKGSIISLSISFILGSLVYFLSIYVLGIEEFTYFINLLKSKIKIK
jgi:putative peptidoglycan lipid II flippase